MNKKLIDITIYIIFIAIILFIQRLFSLLKIRVPFLGRNPLVFQLILIIL